MEYNPKRELHLNMIRIQKVKKVKDDNDTNIHYVKIETVFIKKLRKGSGKYKSKFPVKCFNCGNIRHFTPKFDNKYKDDGEHAEHHGEDKKSYKHDKDKRSFKVLRKERVIQE